VYVIFLFLFENTHFICLSLFYNYFIPALPQITSVSPSAGVSTYGGVVTISGIYLGIAPSISLDGIPCNASIGADNKTFACAVPAGMYRKKKKRKKKNTKRIFYISYKNLLYCRSGS
jgi:hypothetical protein